jgi:hypothetical protein
LSNIYSFEVDGWGEVGPAIDVTNAEGFADGTFTLTTAGTPPPETEYGAMIWVEDCDAVIADGYYTLTARTSGTFTMQALAADVTVTSSAVSGLARIEDHFRISDGIPSWVTGSDAQARWYRDLVSVSESAGQRLSNLGGLASVDGFEVTMARRQGLAAIAPATYLLSTAGPVVLLDPLTSDAVSVVTESATPYAGESASSPTGAAQPAWIGTEAIDVRGTVSSSSTAGVTTYTATHDGSATWVTRGVLRTQKQSHPQGAAVFGTLPTALGQIGRTFVYPESHASHADRTEVARGPVEMTDPSVGMGSAQRFAMASQILRSYRTETGESVAEFWVSEFPEIFSGSVSTKVRSESGSKWKWAQVRELACIAVSRTGSAPLAFDSNGLEEWQYLADTNVSTRSSLPIVRATKDDAAWASTAFSTAGDGVFDGMREAYSDGWGTVDLRELMPEGSTNPFPLIFTSTDDGGEYVLPPQKATLAHVFEPVTWTRPRNAAALVSTALRYIEVNPVDVVLAVLTSTGQGTNGAHDVAPAEFGMAIPVGDIELAGFITIGNKLDTNNVTAGNVAILSSESVVLSDWLGEFLKVYALQVATTTAGAVRLIDMAFVDPDTAHTLDEGDLVGGPATLTLSANVAIESITIEYSRPWVPPQMGQEWKPIARATTRGISDLFQRISGKSARIPASFAAACDDSQEVALVERWSSVIAWNFGVVGTITVDVDPGYAPDLGDTVSVTLPAFPDADDTGPMTSALCRIIDRVHVSRPIGQNPRDTIKLLAYGATTSDKARRWSPSGVVATVATPKSFTLETSTYSNDDYASDAVSFADGVDVDIYTENWSLRSTTAPGTVLSTSGDTVTLSVAATDGGGNVTPNVGDKLALAAESNQSDSEALGWAWLSSTTPGYQWSR